MILNNGVKGKVSNYFRFYFKVLEWGQLFIMHKCKDYKRKSVCNSNDFYLQSSAVVVFNSNYILVKEVLHFQEDIKRLIATSTL